MDGTTEEIIRILTAHRIAADRLEPETELDQVGMDSLRFLDAVFAVESRFGIAFPSEMMVPENFRTPQAIADAVVRLGGGPAVSGTGQA